MTRQATTTAAGPVQGPAAPTHTDLIWATASSQAALDDPALSIQDRQSYLEAEAATYTAAAHLGVDGGTPGHYAAELEHQDLAASAVESVSSSPALGEWAAVSGVEAPEPEAAL
jgi:hypothetical protein